MYEPLLLIHSWVRWAVFFGLLYFLCTCIRAIFLKRAWTASDSHFIWAFHQVFLYQGLFGITIWFGASPIVRAALVEPGAILSTPYLTYWTLLHPLTMIAAIGIFHFGKARANRLPLNARFQAYAVILTIVFVMVMSAIPWPFMSYGRPLIRIP